MANIKYEKDIKISKEKAQVDINITVPQDEYMAIWEREADRIAKTITMPGFRKGKVPVATVKQAKYNEISESAFNRMINEVVADVTKDVEERPISTVRITVVEHEHKENDPEHVHNFEFVLSYSYRIEPKLPDISKIKVEKPNTDVTDEEVKQSLEMLVKSVNSQKEEGKEEITEFTDENVSLLNIPDVDNLEKLTELVKSEIKKQKDYETEMTYRAQILDEVVKQSEITYPELLIEDMIAQQERDYQARIEKLGFDYNKYITEKNIKLDDLRNEWRQLIRADVGRELVLSQYVLENKVEPTAEDLKNSIQNANPELKERYSPEGLEDYMKYMLANNMAFGQIYAQVTGENQ